LKQPWATIEKRTVKPELVEMPLGKRDTGRS
jgi:hypothetical protein